MSTVVSPLPSPAGVTAAPAAPAAAAQPGGAAPAAPAADAAAFQRRIEELEQQNLEKDRAVQHWYTRATTSPEKPAAPAASAEAEPDPLEIIAAKGAKGLDDLLASRGFVRKTDLESAINSKTAQLTTEQKLVKEYPDLNDEKTEFFKATAVHYGELVKMGVSPAVATRMAAEKTDLEFLRAGKTKLPPSKEEKEAERLARVRAQAGDTGGRTADGSLESDDLTPEQEQFAVGMLAGEPGPDGKPRTREQAIEAYKSRAKNGVSMRGGFK